MRLVTPVLLLAALLIALTPRAASAHAELVSSTPEAGATLSAAPAEVTARFSEKLGPDESSLAVVDASGARVDQDDSAVDEPDRESVRVSLKPNLPAGTYTVQWKSLSADDGDAEEGEFRFTIGGAAASAAPSASARPAASPAATASPAASAAASPSASASTAAGGAAALPNTGAPISWRGLVVSGGVLLAALGLLLRRGTRRQYRSGADGR